LIHFSCPRCHTAHQAPDGDAGVKTTCPTCGQRLQIPEVPRSTSKTVLGKPLPAPGPEAIPETGVGRQDKRAAGGSLFGWLSRYIQRIEVMGVGVELRQQQDGDPAPEKPDPEAGRLHGELAPRRRAGASFLIAMAASGAGLCVVLVLWVALRPSTGTPVVSPGGNTGTEPTPGRVEGPRPAALDCTGDVVVAADVRQAQEAWAKHLGRKVEETVEVAGGVTMTFVLVPPGKFRMGSPPEEQDYVTKVMLHGVRQPWLDDETQHGVTLTEPFDLGKTEVTQAQYEVLTGENPSHFKGAFRPVEGVSWQEARDYADRLTEKRDDRHRYRLPTEAEWEYACRGGRSSSKPFGVGDGRTFSSREANFNGNDPYGGADKGPYLQATCAVGSYPANALGLLDMHGNVWEWCADWYAAYPRGLVTNPTGPPEGSRRVYRGGSWDGGSGHCCAARRQGKGPGGRDFNLGFRLARAIR
jgi:formylglycine-generating enzyme required for sulfatase activity